MVRVRDDTAARRVFSSVTQLNQYGRPGAANAQESVDPADNQTSPYAGFNIVLDPSTILQQKVSVRHTR